MSAATNAPLLTFALTLLCVACSGPEASGPEEEPTEAEPAGEGTQEAAATAALDFVPACLDLDAREHPAGLVPVLLADLADDTHDASRIALHFARSGRSTPCIGGHAPTGHMFRWQLVEELSGPRGEFSNTGYRDRLTGLSRNAPIAEGFDNSQIRTFHARLRTQNARELILAARNSGAPDLPSIAELTCDDHGVLPQLTPAHFAQWGLLPDSLSAVATIAGTAQVEEFHGGVEPTLVIRADEAMTRALAENGALSTSEMPDGTLEIRPNV